LSGSLFLFLNRRRDLINPVLGGRRLCHLV
jgi:hypothetical protein